MEIMQGFQAAWKGRQTRAKAALILLFFLQNGGFRLFGIYVEPTQLLIFLTKICEDSGSLKTWSCVFRLLFGARQPKKSRWTGFFRLPKPFWRLNKFMAAAGEKRIIPPGFIPTDNSSLQRAAFQETTMSETQHTPQENQEIPAAVSYTHLTLPTKLEV